MVTDNLVYENLQDTIKSSQRYTRASTTKSKSKIPMVVPLSRQAIELLRMAEASRKQILMLRGPESRAQETSLIFKSTSGKELGN